MKRNSFYLICIILLMSHWLGCGDNTDAWKEHILSEEELAELARQDSIREAQRNSINADLILEYDVKITILENGYDGSRVYIDTVQIADLFGITPTQLAQGIANMGADKPYANAPEIVGFCIEGTTRTDNMTNSNTNSYWGHWWSQDGNTTTWGDNARVFAEYNAEGGFFNVGQMPGLLEPGKEIKFIECLKYQEKRVAVVVKVLPVEQEQVEAGIVGSQDLEIEMPPRSTYDASPLTFDFAKVLEGLGVSSMTDVKAVGLKADGSYAQQYTSDLGFWYDLEGFVGTWGDDASVFIEYRGLGEDTSPEDLSIVYVGQMPDALDVGFTTTLKFGFLANNKIFMLNIKVLIVDDAGS